MFITVFMIAWVCFDAYVYFQTKLDLMNNQPNLMELNPHPVAVAVANVTSNLTNNTSLNGTVSANATIAAASVIKQVTNSSVALHANSTSKVNTGPSPSIVPSNYYGPTIPIWRPFIPNFMNYFSQASGVYEGIPMLPALYSNSQNKHNFIKVVMYVICIISCFLMLFCPLCILAYGTELRDMVLLNLPYGTYETMIQASYSMCLIYNIAINMFPIMNIVNGLR